MKNKGEFQQILDSFSLSQETKSQPLSLSEEAVILGGCLPYIDKPKASNTNATRAYGNIYSYSNWSQLFPFFKNVMSTDKNNVAPQDTFSESKADHDSTPFSIPEEDIFLDFEQLGSEEVFAWMFFEKHLEKWPQKLSFTDLKKSYRFLALRFHPDHNSGQNCQFLTLNECYQSLAAKFESL